MDARSRPAAAAWDAALESGASQFARLPYNAVSNNCHDFASACLDAAAAGGRWHTARVAALLFLRGRHVGAFSGWSAPSHPVQPSLAAAFPCQPARPPCLLAALTCLTRRACTCQHMHPSAQQSSMSSLLQWAEHVAGAPAL